MRRVFVKDLERNVLHLMKGFQEFVEGIKSRYFSSVQRKTTKFGIQLFF